MTIYNVHIYRELILRFDRIEAEAPDAAASIARDKPTDEADDIDDCDGETFSALVDVVGDEKYEQSCLIDFEAERLRKAAPKVLDALRISEGFVHWALDHGADSHATAAALRFICTTIAEAEAAGIPSTPAAKLLAALKDAESFIAGFEDDECQAGINDRLARIRTAIALAEGAGIPSEPTEVDVHALLAGRRQIAAIWGIDDVKAVRPELTDQQAWEVLKLVDRRHDAEVGINWVALQCAAEELYGDAPDTDEPEEE